MDAPLYTCPMHPEVQRDRPGMCPECGMKLAPGSRQKAVGSRERTRHASHGTPEKHAGQRAANFARKFWVSLVLTVPVVLTSDVAERLFGRAFVGEPAASWSTLVLGSVVFFYGGWVFLAGAWRELRGRLPGMMTLIALAILTAYAYSVMVTLSGRGEPLFWELTTLITVMLLGHWIEMRAVRGAQGALRELSKLLPETAEVVRQQATGSRQQDETRVVPLSELRVGDLVLVRPGGKIPADGTVADGASDINEALVTGESQPVAKRGGSPVIAGTINGDGVLRVRVTHIGERTFLAGVLRLVADAQTSKSRLQVLSDRAAFALTVVAVVTGAITLAAWLGVRAGLGMAIERTVAVLVIACPHALGLAVPLVASISTTIAARHGLLIRQRLALESARRLDTVLFDKTGTLTKGAFGVERVWPASAASEADVLALAASVDAQSEHVIAKAIVAEAKRRGLALRTVDGATAVPGQGIRGTLDGEPVAVGGHAMRAEDERLPKALEGGLGEAMRTGRSVVYVWKSRTLVGAITLADVIREESRAAVRALTGLGLRVAMVTGDAREVAQWVARELGIAEVFARVQPAEKTAVVQRLQAEGRRVAFVGDGINDAPALTRADVGIAIGAGTNVAIESAGILLVRNDPRDVVAIVSLARATYRKMVENLFWATGYNLVALPLAAGVLASRGVVLQPAVSALFMSLSTVIVAINAMLLRRLRLGALPNTP